MSDLFIRQELIRQLPKVDALVLDVDGVVLDVSQSYRVVICDTTQYWAVQHLGLEDNARLLTSEEVEFFKRAGGFNDDNELTQAAAMLVTARRARSNATDAATVQATAPTWEEYCDEIRRHGGGYAAAEKVAMATLTVPQRRAFAHDWLPRLVSQIFQEMYGGDSMCATLFGFNPQLWQGEGYHCREKVLLDRTLLPERIKIGLLTGRLVSETRHAVERAGLRDRVPEKCWVTSEDGVRKPDGRTLVLCQQRLGFQLAIYVGDTLDDHRTVMNYRELPASGRGRVVSCLVLTGPAGDQNRAAFLEAGADIVAPDVNALLQFFKAAR